MKLQPSSEFIDYKQRRNEYKKSLNRKNIDCTEAMNQLQEIQVIVKKKSSQSPLDPEKESIQSSKKASVGKLATSKQKESTYSPSPEPPIIFEDKADEINQNFETFLNTQCRVPNYHPPDQPFSIHSSEILDSSQISAANKEPIFDEQLKSGKNSCTSIKSLKSVGSIHSIRQVESQLSRRSLDNNKTPTIQQSSEERLLSQVKKVKKSSKVRYLIILFLAVFLTLFLLQLYEKATQQ